MSNRSRIPLIVVATCAIAMVVDGARAEALTTEEYTYTSDHERRIIQLDVPPGLVSMHVALIGGRGAAGTGTAGQQSANPGGIGSYVAGWIQVKGTFGLVVGANPSNWNSTDPSSGLGSATIKNQFSGAGGGATYVWDDTGLIAVAGGGGGGGGGNATTGNTPVPSFANGLAGDNAAGPVGGTGGAPGGSQIEPRTGLVLGNTGSNGQYASGIGVTKGGSGGAAAKINALPGDYHSGPGGGGGGSGGLIGTLALGNFISVEGAGHGGRGGRGTSLTIEYGQFEAVSSRSETGEATLYWTIPNTFVSRNTPTGFHVENRVVIQPQSTERNSSVWCTLDDDPEPVNCTARFSQYLDLDPHTLKAWAVNYQGNYDPTPAEFEFEVVAEPPPPVHVFNPVIAKNPKKVKAGNKARANIRFAVSNDSGLDPVEVKTKLNIKKAKKKKKKR